MYKKWSDEDLALQTLYNVLVDYIDDMKPKFGSSVRLPLTEGGREAQYVYTEEQNIPKIELKSETSSAQFMSPTLLNLVWHFGRMEWMLDNIRMIMKKSKGHILQHDIHQNFLKSSQENECRKFEQDVVKPLRHALLKVQQPLYLYCIPAITLIVDQITGELRHESAERVLCVLPVYVRCAEAYGLSAEEIQLLAPQVLWLIKNLCGYGVIKTHSELERALDMWPKYVTNQMIVEHFRNKIMNDYQHLLSQNVLKLLPCASVYES